MDKKRILFVAHHLTIGGVQKSLVSALSAVDYDKYEVGLYVRKNRLDVLPFIDKRVKVIINDDKTHYYRHPKIVWYSAMEKVFSIIKKPEKARTVKQKSAVYIRDAQMEYEKERFFSGIEYDVAVAYVQGVTALFVDRCVNAAKKIVFYQGSVDESHEIHEKVFPHYDLIAVEHGDIKKLLCGWYSGIEDKIRVVENYTDYTLIRRLGEEETVPKDENGVTLCTCSRFSPEKGIDLAAEAAAVLKERGVRFRWYLVGDGPERGKVEAIVKERGLEDCVVLAGMRKNPYVYMRACDIYVQPSRNEALSISMLESQIMCAPMVSTRTAGGLAMVREGVNGTLADIDPVSLADAIERLANDRQTLGKMRAYLESLDYSAEEKRYKEDWKRLLEQ